MSARFLNTKRQYPPYRAQGFTIIELLVTLAIIGLLAGLLLPSLAQAKSTARATKCRSNLRQIGIALQSYASDWSFYPTFYTASGSLSETDWLVLCTPYLGRLSGLKEIRQCPAEQKSDLFTTYGYNFEGTSPFYIFGQQPKFGLGLGGERDQHQRIHATPELGVIAPSQFFAVADGFYASMSKGIYSANWIGVNLSGRQDRPDEERRARRLHRGHLQVLSCDAHVEALHYRQFLMQRDAQTLSRWNNDNQPHVEILQP